tara:strand:+ start:7844 stop:8230 length:387 start_codon:yes stop_codon:yes gene_type:complete
MRFIINFLLLLIVSACSSLQSSNIEGEYKYVPVTEALKQLSDEELATRLRRTSLTCENEMLKVYVPSKALDPDGWQAGQEERRRYFNNCLELKGFERKFFSAAEIKKINKKENKEMTPEEYIEKPRFY